MFGIVRKNKNSAFSLLELIVVVAIMGLMAAIIMPNLKLFKKRQVDKEFSSSLNYISKLAYDNAANTGKMHKVVFDFDNMLIYIEQKDGENYTPYENSYLTTSVSLKDIEIINIYINGKDEMELKPGESKKNTVWYFIVPNGLAQEVSINYDVGELQKNLVIDPFNATFKGGNGYKIT